jgi:hypothetical protein
MAIPKIKTNLFSFKTFRSPDKIDINDINDFFIQHPDITQSQFNQCPIRNEDGSNEQDYNTFVASFRPKSSYKEIRNLNPVFYDYSSLLMQQKKNDSSKKRLSETPPTPLTDTLYLQIWEELFIQITTQKSNSARQACLQMIIAQFYVTNIERLELKDISKLVIVIPQIVIDCFKPWQYAQCGGKLFGVHNLGIQEYRRVEQTLCCYVPGEVSHIENVMAREFKEKSTRNLLRTEQTTELTTETTIENINDTTTTERNELSSEVAKLLQKDKSFDISGSVSVSKDSKIFGSITANASTGYNNSSSSALSNTEAKNYAKEITERALERIEQKTTERRTYKIIKEFEENNKHGFDNRKGTRHVTGVYRWVDKIYDNELVNYGKRLVLEVEVPNPALLYKKAMEWKSKKKEQQQDVLTPPKPLSQFGINSWSDIENENVANPASEYGITISSYQTEVRFVDVNFSAETDHFHATKTDIQSPIMIEPGFVADRIDGIGSFQHRGNVSTKAYLRLNFGSQEIYRGDYNSPSKQTDTFNISLNIIPKALGSLAFSVSYRKVFQYSGSIKVKCVSDPALYREWQENAFVELQEAYQKKLDEYNEALQLQQAALAAQADQEGSENFSNAAFNRLIEERELKRACIEMLSKPYCYELGKRFYDCKTYKCTSCEDEEDIIEATIPETRQNQQLEKYAEFIKFFETAFQWEIFSYIFYPYYYNEKCSWYELLQTKSSDPIFEAFLQSGMAKILIPVRPQFEKAVMWYLDTGEIYTEGDLIPETADDRYESLLKDLQGQDEVRVEGTWQTRVPSMLTIIQAKSTYLEDEQGLPCCEEEDETFGSDDRLLEGLDNIDNPIIED